MCEKVDRAQSQKGTLLFQQFFQLFIFSWVSVHNRLLLLPNKSAKRICAIWLLYTKGPSVVFANLYQFERLELHADYWFVIYTCSELGEAPVLSFVSVTSDSAWTLAVTSGHVY